VQHRNVRLSSNAAPGGRRGAAGSCACCVLRKFGVAQSNELLRPMVEAAVDAFFDQVPPAALPPTAPPYSSRTPPALEVRLLAERGVPVDETCPISTEGWTGRVHFVREGNPAAFPAHPR
jgi:hypothetical protein